MSRVKHSLLASAVALVLIVLALWIWTNRQFVQDFMVAQRPVSQQVASIAERSAMSFYGKVLFYASEPEISNAETFNSQCGRQEATTAILGCYSSGRIYIYHITNPDLDGIEEVTAAHEMLHAAWERLSEGERLRLEGELEKAYERVKTPELEERMEYYQRQQPGERANELHSILGTEAENLGEALEKHYRNYFENRHVITSFHSAYEAVFSVLERKAEALRVELEADAPKINAAIAKHNKDVDTLNAEIVRHNQLAASIDRRSVTAVTAYNTRRAALLAEQRALDNERAALDKRRQDYNEKLDEYNALVIRSTTLTDSIDSFKAPTSLGEQT